MLNKGEREELRRLLKSRFKVLRADVDARAAELEIELRQQVQQRFAGAEKAHEDAVYQVRQAVDEANRKANDICRELYGKEQWGTKFDKTVVHCAELPRPSDADKRQMQHDGKLAIAERVKKAKLELDRQENELLTELATAALESAEAREFFNRIPAASELVPAYRLPELGD